MRSFLQTPDAAQVLELMREAEVTALELTDAVHWPGEDVHVSVMLMMPPVRLVLRRRSANEEEFLAVDIPLPGDVSRRLEAALEAPTLWKRVRRQLDESLKLALSHLNRSP